MKTFRLWLLVLLAVLLPLRGAVAAGMLCSTASGDHVVADSGRFASTPGHGDGHHHGHTHSPVSASDTAKAAGSSSGHDSCNLCVAYCSVTALPASLPAFAAPLAPALVSFPYFAAAAPSFISGGLERPPRSF